MNGGTLNLKQIRDHWDEILRLVTSIKQGTVIASLMMRKLSSYPRQNGLSIGSTRSRSPQARPIDRNCWQSSQPPTLINLDTSPI
jgi:hypothetical protein